MTSRAAYTHPKISRHEMKAIACCFLVALFVMVKRVFLLLSGDGSVPDKRGISGQKPEKAGNMARQNIW